MDEEVVSTKRFFESHHITLSDYWLESCIQWYREEHPNSNYTLDILHLKVYEQWLLLDLRDVEVPILPPNLRQQVKGVLNGIFSLQMLQVVDISRPKLMQIQKLRNSSAFSHTMADQEYQTNNLGKRMLQLLLTDGVQEIEAIEYKPVRALNVDLAPGTKIRISGPVTVRRGQILLEEKHINILGGEVEELLVVNAAENILASALNLPLNPNPHTIEESLASANMDVIQSATNERNFLNTQSKQDVNHAQASSSNEVPRNRNQQGVNVSNDQLPSKIDSSIPKQQPLIIPTHKASSDFITEDDELRIMAEVDMLLEAERDIQEGKPVVVERMDVFEDAHINTDTVLKIENIEKAEKVGVFEDPHPNADDVLKIENTKNFNDVETETPIWGNKKDHNFEMDRSIFEDIDIDAHLDVIDKQIEDGQKQKGIVAISELVKNRNNITGGKFTVKAKFKSVVQKLTVTIDAWSLKLLITDGTGDLETYVHSDIISNFMGYCPSAMMALKEDILNKDECATATVMKTIEGLKGKIMELNCVMEILFTPDEICPTIVNLK